ncbi:MAG: serpin family protein [archaeon]
MKNGILPVWLLLALVLAMGCTGDRPPASPQPADDSQATPEGVSGLIGSNTQFALAAYSELKADGENLFISPWSISTALAMAYEGARGETAEEMLGVFHFPEDDTARRSSFASLYNRLNAEGKAYKLHTANALWAQQDYKFLDGYLTTVESYYGGKATNVDFLRETEKSRITINTWVEGQTNNKIKDLFPEGTITPDTSFVLTNAVYFKGDWLKQFDKADTRDEDFRVSPYKTVKVPMMKLTGEEANFKYTETDDLQILEMPYVGEQLSMLVLLPKDGDISALENSLSLEKLSEWRAKLQAEDVDVYLPKFTFETKYDLTNSLISMGMPTAFSPAKADFSGMDGTRNLYIGIVLHQAYIDVNEEGTEVAAATGVAMKFTGFPMPPKIFRADHPFLFIIQETETGNIIFIGKVADPTA